MLLFCVSVLGAGRMYHPGGDRRRCHGRYVQGQRKFQFHTLFLIKNPPLFYGCDIWPQNEGDYLKQ